MTVFVFLTLFCYNEINNKLIFKALIPIKML